MMEEMKRAQEEQTDSLSEHAGAKNVTFADMEPAFQGDAPSQNMEFLLDVPLEITVELGKTRLSIGDLLKLSQGSVVELNKLTDQPLEIFVNKKLIAQGEVVVVNDRFGVRLTNIISPGERVRKLG